MPVLKNVKHEKFAQLCATGLSRAEAYRRVAGVRAGKNSDANSDDWLNARGVRKRIQELQERNSRKSEMTREELMAFYAAVIRTPADRVPAGSPVIQAYEMTESGPKIRICDKAAAGAQLAKMCGWNEPDKVEMSADSLTSYLRELRSRSLGDYGQAVEGFTVVGDKATPIIELGANGENHLFKALAE